MKRVVLFALLVATNAFAARDSAQYERVLLPFTGTTPGALGTWSVQWWVRNDGNAAVDVFPLAFFCGLCATPGRFTLAGPIQPHHTPLVLVGDALPAPLVPVPPAAASVAEPPGALLYVERGKNSQLTITGFLTRDGFFARRRSVSSGLHAIPESRFRTGARSIFVPIVPGSRYALRIFALPESVNDEHVTIRSLLIAELTSDPDETLIATSALQLVTPSTEDLQSRCFSPCDLPRLAYKPAVAEMSLAVPQREGTMRIEIAPDSGSVRWWAVVSATSASDDVQFFEPSDL